MSRKYVRRFAYYHPSLFVDRFLVVDMQEDYQNVNIPELSRILIRYRRIKQSYCIMKKLKKIAKNLNLSIEEIITLNRVYSDYLLSYGCLQS